MVMVVDPSTKHNHHQHEKHQHYHHANHEDGDGWEGENIRQPPAVPRPVTLDLPGQPAT